MRRTERKPVQNIQKALYVRPKASSLFCVGVTRSMTPSGSVVSGVTGEIVRSENNTMINPKIRMAEPPKNTMVEDLPSFVSAVSVMQTSCYGDECA